ncbi:MAG: pentapeptide repeat-containing protein [Chloroflexota bacterium]
MNFLNLLVVGLYYFGKRNIWNFLVILALIGITGIGFYQSAQAQGIVDAMWWSGMWQNFATEMIGAIMTFALFEILINANTRQEMLTRQMASSDNATAINAVNELRALGYLFEGTLHSKSFREANLAGVDLSEASLVKVNLRGANLRQARLVNVDLSGADLRYADLSGATMMNIHCDTTTILPDERLWSPDVDWSLYTHSTHSTQANLNRPQSHPYRNLRLKRTTQKSFSL